MRISERASMTPPEFPKAKLIAFRWSVVWWPLFRHVRIANAVLVFIGPLTITIRRPWLPAVVWSEGWDRGYWAGKSDADSAAIQWQKEVVRAWDESCRNGGDQERLHDLICQVSKGATDAEAD